MPHISRGVEYALHCMLYLGESSDPGGPSVRELAEFQGVPEAFVGKLFTRLEKSGLVRSSLGVRGGYELARPAERITVLEVVEAVDGRRPLFQCTEVRRNCVLFGESPPVEVTRGVCGIHRVMQEADTAMRTYLESRTLADIGAEVSGKLPVRLLKDGRDWFESRALDRAARRRSGREGETGGERSK